MRNVALALALLLAVTVATPVAAGESSTFHGRITDGHFACGDVPATPYDSVEGSWNLNVTGRTGVVTINVFYDGSHHLSFGMSGGSVTRDGDLLIVTFGTATLRLGHGAFSWSTPAGTCSETHPYDSLTYVGTAER